jgi:ATP-dependent Lon protease
VSEIPEFTLQIGGETLQIPAELPLLPVRNTVLFPGTTQPLSVGRPRSLKGVRQAAESSGLLAILTQRDPSQERPDASELFEVGTIGRTLQVIDTGAGLSVVVVGLARFRVLEVLERDDIQWARIELVPDVLDRTAEAEAARRAVQRLAKELIELRDDLPDELHEMVDRLSDPVRLSDLLSFTANISIEEKMALLAQPDVLARLRVLIRYLMRETRVARVSKSFAEGAAGKIDEAQRKKLLREQLRKIQEELGETDEQAAEGDQLRERIDEAGLPDDVRDVAERELSRMNNMPGHSPERAVSRTYVEWLLDLPWTQQSEDNLDLAHARQILDEDHYGLEKIKERIVEYLAVRHLVDDSRGPILCFVGPPGVGKTSLGKSIARAMGREFVRSSLGGVRDEAEIRGHRRTYVGALPGRMIQQLKTAKTNNPVFVLDEIDKVGTDYRGDPSSALLEVLDPEQNSSFSDHYIEIPFDLSRVLFVATANRTDTIPPPLLDRMEVIELPGYTAREKLNIAKRFLLPRQLSEHGVRPEQLEVQEETLLRIVEEYTREAGVRNLEREIAALVRKSALRIAEGQTVAAVKPDELEDMLGPPAFTRQLRERIERPGIAVGMMWTPVGGEIVFVEAALLKGKPGMRLTGQLGEVMQESAEAALSYLKANAERLGIDPELFEENEIHIHLPSGALKKDGPSAGVTLCVTLASLLQGRAVRDDLAMTGEITLRGQVLPVGGIKEKILAAHRAGIERLLLPARNEKDLEDLPEEVLRAMEIRFVDNVDEALSEALLPVD